MTKAHSRDTAGNYLWQPIHDWIIRQIEGDTWATGTCLPSVRELAKLFDTSIGTVQRALDALEADAWLRIVPKVGVFVAARGAAPSGENDFSGVNVQVDKAVVEMLSQAVQPGHVSFSSAVLADELIPHTLLNRCLAFVAKQADASVHGLAAPPGMLALRRRIANMMLARGITCGPDDILITSGDSVSLELALAAAAPRGAQIAIETPTYYGILQVIERLGMKAVPIPTDRHQGISVDQLSIAVSHHHIDAIFLNPTLHNPLGFIMPDESRQKLALIARTHDIPIIEDDVFFDLATESPPTRIPPENTSGQRAAPKAIQRKRGTTIAAPARHHRVNTIKSHNPENTIYCSSFSKTLTPGYRVGWCIPGKFRAEIMAQMFSRNLSVSSIAQAVLAEFLGRKYLDPHIASLKKRLAENNRYLHQLVSSRFPQGTRHRQPHGGFIHWIEFPADIDINRLMKEALDRGCQINRNGIFFPDGRSTQAIRICLGRSLSPAVTHALITLADSAHNQRISVRHH